MDKVLLVEDEDIIRRGLLYAVDWLKEDCVVVGEAIDGVDGLEKIDTLRPDIVITDVKMPYLDGLGMLEQSRDRGYEAIILSGYDEFSYAKRAISLDVTEYLLKPVDFDALHESLVRAKERLRRRAETATGAGICRICTSGDFSIGGGARRQIYGKTSAPHSRGLCRATVATGYCRRVWSVRGISAEVFQTGYELHL